MKIESEQIKFLSINESTTSQINDFTTLQKMKNIFLISTLLLLFSCGKEETKKEEFEVVAAENQISVNDAQFKTAGIEIGTLGKEEISAKITLNGSIAVSYTHLDVYKRQFLHLLELKFLWVLLPM